MFVTPVHHFRQKLREARKVRKARRAGPASSNAAATAALAQQLFPGAQPVGTKRRANPMQLPDSTTTEQHLAVQEALPVPQPTSEEVQTLRLIALQLKQRIESLHQEARQAQAAGSASVYAPLVAWGEPVTGPTGPHPYHQPGLQTKTAGTQMSAGGFQLAQGSTSDQYVTSSSEEDYDDEDYEMQEHLRQQHLRHSVMEDSPGDGLYSKKPRLSVDDIEVRTG